jgi:hypothetical protein
MDAGLLSTLRADLGALMPLTGETITLVSTVYNCFITGSSADGLTFEEGGATLASTAQVAIRKTDLPTPPQINSYATFRGETYRVHQTRDLTTTWEIVLVQQKA